MPQLVNYINRARPAKTYDEVDLAKLQQVYDTARRELGMSEQDPHRERLALLIFSVAAHSGIDAHLTGRVIAAYRAR